MLRRMAAVRFVFSIGAKRLIGLPLSRESRVKLLTNRAIRGRLCRGTMRGAM